MRKIGVYCNFLDEGNRAKIDAAAVKAGFAVTYYDSDRDTDRLAAEIGDYEVLFGYLPPSLLAGAKQLRWLCAASAGVEIGRAHV